MRSLSYVMLMTSASPDTYRLFFALWPGNEVRSAIHAHAEAWGWPPSSARVRADDFHITLHFLGNVAGDRLPALQTQRVAFEPFLLRLGYVERWPHGIAVLRPHATPPELTRLHSALADPIASLGLRIDEREYRPHVTLARKAASAIPPQECPGIEWRVDRFALVQSRSNQQPRYTILCEYPAN